MTILFGPDPIQAEVQAILTALEEGAVIDHAVERQYVDLKEEHGRRDRQGNIGPSNPRNQEAAQELAAAAACMANTPGGGALIVGVSNDGQLIGTDLEAEWLRHRLWELSGKALTIDIAIHQVLGRRLLVMRSPQALEPIRVNGKVRWRVGTHCIEIDAHTWHARRMADLNYDWSSEASTVSVDAARPLALDVARELLRDSAEAHSAELAAETDLNLLRRLNVVAPSGMLTNAGVIAFVGRNTPCLDYVRRAQAGGDSLSRIRREGRSLIEELAEVFQAVDANTPTIHLQQGLVIGQQREIPRRAAREAIVNGVAHREWGVSEPTLVEHVGRLLRVTSPGGFVGGVTADNIITHPSRSRNRALAELLASLRVAEREGIGVDRMVADMVSVGHPAPVIEEVPGPYVRAELIGDDLDIGWIRWLRSIDPASEADDLNSLLILRQLVGMGWIDPLRAATTMQDTVGAASGAIAKLSRTSILREPIIETIIGFPDGTDPVWRLSERAAGLLRELDDEANRSRPWPSRERVASSYARARGRISSTELASLVGAYSSNVGPVLKRLEEDGVLAPSRTTRRGKGFYYRYVEPDADATAAGRLSGPYL